jgi:hypothetical protein
MVYKRSYTTSIFIVQRLSFNNNLIIIINSLIGNMNNDFRIKKLINLDSADTRISSKRWNT